MKKLATRYEFFTYPIGGAIIWLLLHFCKGQYWVGCAFFVASLLVLPILILQRDEVFINDTSIFIGSKRTIKVKQIDFKEVKSFQVQPVLWWATQKLAYKKIHVQTWRNQQVTIDGRWIDNIEQIEELLRVSIDKQKQSQA